MEIRFLGDADLDNHIAAGVMLREPTIHFELARNILPPRTPDLDVLSIAANLGRVLVSHDVHTMPVHFADFITHPVCPGVVLIPRFVRIAQAIENLVMMWRASDAEEWVNTLIWLPL